MRLLAYAKLLSRKIRSAEKLAKNPFLDYEDVLNPFSHPLSSTLVWIEPDDNYKKTFNKY